MKSNTAHSNFLVRIVLCGLLMSSAFAQAPDDKRINYSTEKKSVQYVVIDLAAQIGLGYDFQKSFAQTDPACRRWVTNLSIKNQPFNKAMRTVLDPVALRYQVENGKVVLYPR